MAEVVVDCDVVNRFQLEYCEETYDWEKRKDGPSGLSGDSPYTFKYSYVCGKQSVEFTTQDIDRISAMYYTKNGDEPIDLKRNRDSRLGGLKARLLENFQIFDTYVSVPGWVKSEAKDNESDYRALCAQRAQVFWKSSGDKDLQCIWSDHEFYLTKIRYVQPRYSKKATDTIYIGYFMNELCEVHCYLFRNGTSSISASYRSDYKSPKLYMREIRKDVIFDFNENVVNAFGNKLRDAIKRSAFNFDFSKVVKS